MASKREFQTYAKRFNISIQYICADNGVYTAGQFQVSCEEDNQELTFCAVGSHWQNGVQSNTSAWSLKWPAQFSCTPSPTGQGVLNEEFWPFAISHAVNFHNASLDPVTKKSPYQLFTGQPAPWRLQDFRVFGCPVFVLDKRLQDGDSLQKWKIRCWTGVYIEQSLQHAGHAPLIYNSNTTHVTPQYHLTFDDQFKTVTGCTARMPKAEYQRLYQSTDWLFPYAFGQPEDLYLFESYWADPPPLKTGSVKSTAKPKYQKRIPKPSSNESSAALADGKHDTGELTDASGIAEPKNILMPNTWMTL